MFSSYIITETNLGIQSAEVLLNSGHHVLGMITKNENVIRWSRENQIPHFYTIKDFEDICHFTKFDYLFSIVNSQILSDKVLKLPKYFTINYHDSPLPKYKGINATSWAILNDEKEHGITWHKVDSGIDTGEILKQAFFPIKKDDTALSLNLECYTQALKAFKELVIDLEHIPNLSGKIQNKEDKSYFGKYQKPSNLGFVSFMDTAENIERQFRALYFGHYSNTLTTFKIMLENNIYILTSILILNDISHQSTGKIIDITKDFIDVSTLSNNIRLEGLRLINTYKPMCLNNLNHTAMGKMINNFTEQQRKELELLAQSTNKYESLWMKEVEDDILNYQPLGLRLGIEQSSHNILHTKQNLLKTIEYYYGNCIDYQIQNELLVEDIIAAFVLCIYKLEAITNLDNKMSVYFETQFFQNIQEDLKPFFIGCFPINLDISNQSTFKEIRDNIKAKINLAEKSKICMMDIPARCSNLHTHLVDKIKPEIPIYITIGKNTLPKNRIRYNNTIIELNIDNQKKTLTFRINKSKIRDNIIEKLLTNLHRYVSCTLQSAYSNLDIKIIDIQIIPNEEVHKILKEFNNQDVLYPNKTISELFEEQVKNTSNNIAIVYGNTKLTYNELNKKANKLAHYLITYHNIKPNTLIPIMFDRSENMLIAILAILKVGGAYVPIDPEYPDERIKYIIQDIETGSSVNCIIVTNDKYATTLKEIVNTITNILSIDNYVSGSKLQSLPDTNLSIAISDMNLAYVIYTSGTTGKPKGVMIEHKGVVNLINDLNKRYALKNFSEENILQLSNYVFDASVEQIMLALLNGYTLVGISNDILFDMKKFYDYLNAHKITHIDGSPTLLNQYDFNKIPTLNRIVYGGEALGAKHLNCLMHTNNCMILNAYGPTETTITTTVNLIRDNQNLSIGYPIANTKAYILAPGSLTLLPIGAIGELCVGGIGLARGYLNQPDLTAERFIDNPFQTEEEALDKSYGTNGRNTRLYRTGDLVRWRFDGTLEYIGRTDFQVKIRGFRIELGEIEGTLSLYEDIKQCVVIAKEHTDLASNSKYLAAYYITASGKPLEEQPLLSYLSSRLPDYMVPSVFIWLEQLPITINGKLDRKALPEVKFGGDRDTYIAPRNELESKLCSIFAEVLGLDASVVSIRDDFFRMGGDSIISMQLISRIRQRLGLWYISIKDIFTYKTIEKIYDNVVKNNLENSNHTPYIITEQDSLLGNVPLLPIQKWFFNNNFNKPNHWNQAFLVRVPDTLDVDRLKDAINALIEYHDAFRLRYTNNTQYYDDKAANPSLKLLDVSTIASEDKINTILTSWQNDFDLKHGPMCSIGYLYGFKDGSTRIFVALHHLIVDTVSWRILVEDLERLYYELNTEEKIQKLILGSKGTSYRQWANFVKDYKNSHGNERLYWANVISDLEKSNKVLDAFITSCKSHATISFDEAFTSKLLKNSSKAYNTEINDLLLSALSLTLSEILNSNVNHIILEGHGREEISQELDITRTMGWFTTMYPIRLTTYNSEDGEIIGDMIKYTKELLRQVPNKGIGYGALIGYQDDTLPKISFNYLGQLDQVKNSEHNNKNIWNIVNEPSGIWVDGNNEDKSIININGFILDGKLSFSIVSNLSDEVTRKFTKSFTVKLRAIIEHTSTLPRTYLTESDIEKVVKQSYLDKIQNIKEVEAVYIANSLHQGFIYHFLNQGDVDDAYIVQAMWQYKEKLNLEALHESWAFAQKKYPSLRLRFKWDEELVQIVDKEGKLDWRYIDLSKIKDANRQERKIRHIQKQDRQERYNLEVSGLFRIYIIKQRDDLYSCLLSEHHAMIDGWSAPILIRYVHDTYIKLAKGLNKAVIDTSVDKTYFEAQSYLQKTRRDNEEYWQHYVSRIEEHLELSGLISNSSLAIHALSKHKEISEPQEKTLIIQDTLYNALKSLSTTEGITLNTILQYTWHKILRMYGSGNNKDIATVVGTTVAGRNIPLSGIEDSVGLYINTLPFIIDHNEENGNINILDFLKKVQNDIAEINTRSNVSLSRLQKNGDRLFETLFVFENYPTLINEKADNKKDALLKIEFKKLVEKLDYPLSLIVREEINDAFQNLSLTIKYAKELFQEQIIDQLLSTTEIVLRQISESKDEKKILTEQKLTYLTKKQEYLLLHTYNNTDSPYPYDKTIPQLFEEQAIKNSTDIAVVEGNNNTYTYEVLYNENKALAYYIVLHNKKHNLKNLGQLIGILSEKGYNQVICPLAIMKSGGCYLPLNVDWPLNKIDEVLSEGQVSTLFISKSQYKNKDLADALDKKYKLIVIEDTILKIKDKAYFDYLKTEGISLPQVNNRDIAYVIFTSGSTGKPKGVTISHKGAINTIYAINKEFCVNTSDRVLSLSEFSFDLSVYDIFGMLFAGGVVVFPTQSKIQDINHWWRLIYKNQVTIWNTVPQLADLLINANNINQQSHNSLRLFLLSGDYVPKQLTNTLMSHIKDSVVISLGGATEGSIWSIWYRIPTTNQEWTQVPYGYPMPNQKMYVLNSYKQCCPIGATGEIYIGGAGVAINYWNNRERTKESFFNHPTFGRIYKTGDLGRWNKNLYMEYIGRTDFQVKIRGFRIELGEIEGTLSLYEDIKQCVVIAKEHADLASNSKYLAAYYITASGKPLEEQPLLSYLSSRLPDYMVPSVFIWLEQLPITINGKLDRKALPEVKFGGDRDTYIAPRNELESKLCSIFAEVLGLDASVVSIRDDFFRMGGDSIMAIRLVSKIIKNTSLAVNVAAIFAHKNIENLVRYLKNNNMKEVIIEQYEVKHEKDQLLSFAQERLWFIEKYEKGTNAYNVPMIMRINKKVNIDTLKKSIEAIIERHEILRTYIREDKQGNGYQVVSYDLANYIEEIDISNKLELDAYLMQDEHYIYDLANEYPIKVRIYHLDSSQYIYLCIIVHHIAFDGWSTDIFLNELETYYQYYNNKSNDTPIQLLLPALSIQYKDFALWQRNYLTGAILNRQLSYWQNKLEGYKALDLPTDYVRPIEIDYKGKELSFQIERDLSFALREVAKSLSVSLYSLLLAGYYLMLKAYTEENDLVIGTPVANRHSTQIQHLIGLFVNTLALRININPTSKIVDFVKYIGNEVIAAQLYQDLPFESLVDALQVPKDTSRHPIFQIMFGVQGFGTRKTDHKKRTDQCILELYEGKNKTSATVRFDIETFIDDSREMLEGSCIYRESLYREETIRGFIDTYLTILTQLKGILQNPELTLQEFIYLTQEQKNVLLHTYNNTNSSDQDYKVIHQIFENQVTQYPDNIALVYGDIQLTYNELNEKANRLAHYLMTNHNIEPNVPVIMCLDRSEDTIISILAILKAGGAYVPLDIDYPSERVKYILDDTNSKVIITNKRYAIMVKKIINREINILSIDDRTISKVLSNTPNTNPATLTDWTNLAYIIYTSGTTGEPKGVMIEHRAVSSLVKDVNYIQVNSNDTSIQLSNLAFDAANFEIWSALLNGGKLFIPTNVFGLLSNTRLFKHTIYNNNITILWLTKTLFDQLFLLDNEIFQKVKYLLVGGEALNPKLIKAIINSQHSPLNVINGYGPTENTTFSCTFNITKDNIKNINSIPIGAPITNRKAYILAPGSLTLLPIGAIGELCVGGIGLARGYLNQPDLTAERFIDNPFQTEEEALDKSYGTNGRNTRLYRTGDLVRWRFDGTLEYIGRTDFQVKIRGFRIELGEIEGTLSLYEDIKQCVVIAKEHTDLASNSKYLAAYYITASGKPLEEQPLLSYLSSRLPDYMVPSVFIWLEQLPITINGKLDRKALPEVKFGGDRDTYIAPRNELESKLCSIFAEVLGLDASVVSIRDDFFRMGGDSIISMQLISRIRQRLGLWYISIKDIFTYKTIEKIYDNVVKNNLENSNHTPSIITEQDSLLGNVPLLPIQKWFFNNNFNKPNHWNQAFLVRVPDTLDVDRLKDAINALIEYHDAFRLRYTNNTQYYDDKAANPSLKLLDVSTIASEDKINTILTSWQNDFDLKHGPMCSIGYLYGFKDGSTRIFVALHHLIVDTVSWRILVEDLERLYYELNTEEKIQKLILGSKGTSYRQWANFVKDYKNSHGNERLYWANVISDLEKSNKVLDAFITSCKSHATISFDEAFTSKLLKNSSKAYNTEINDLLLSALSLTLSEILNSNVNHIILEGHGREEISQELDITRTMGWFTTMYPIRLTTYNSEDGEIIGDTIKYTKELLRQVPNKGIGYGALIGYQDDTLPKISFNYLGQLDQVKNSEHNNKNIWNIVNEPSGIWVDGNNEDKSIININGFISNSSLNFEIITKLNDQNTRLFTEVFKDNINKIIMHCSHHSISEYTPSDFTDFNHYIQFNSIKPIELQDRLFIFPPGEGGAESYFNNLIPKLENLNLIAFNNYYHFLKERREVNLSECITYKWLSNYYVSYIKSIQPNGPYHLFGWSLGAIVAFEVARQLIIMGDKVKNIFMIDPLFNIKTVLTKTNIKSKYLFDKINHEYTPNYSRMENTQIHLFKANKLLDSDDHSEELYKVFKYYVEETEYNHLESLCDKKLINIQKLDSNHYNWVNNQDSVKIVSSTILKALAVA